MFCISPMLLWWVLRRISVVCFEVKLSSALSGNIWCGACNNAMSLSSCANSIIPVNDNPLGLLDRK